VTDGPGSAREPVPPGAAGEPERFPLRSTPWAAPFLVPFAPGRHAATIGGGVLEVRLGLLGRARVPVRLVERVSAMRWPWWGGVGVRIGRGLVAFVAAPGDAAVVELSEPVTLRAPLRWRTRRLVVGVEDVEGFARALARARHEAG
jgi:hypothetical protein